MQYLIRAVCEKEKSYERFISWEQIMSDLRIKETEKEAKKEEEIKAAGETEIFWKFVEYLAEYLKQIKPFSKSDIVKTMIEYAMDSIDQHITVEAVAEHLYMNRQYLSVLFKKETGSRFSDYLKMLKISRAKYMLGDKIVTEVSDLMGFSDPEYFSRVFKGQVGITPSMYIKIKSNGEGGFTSG